MAGLLQRDGSGHQASSMGAPTQKDTRAHAGIESELGPEPGPALGPEPGPAPGREADAGARVDEASAEDEGSLTDTTHAGRPNDGPDDAASFDEGEGDLPPGTMSGGYVVREKIG